MTARLGRITARLAEPDVSECHEIVDRINRNINPPVVLTPSDVYIRAMYVVSDSVNSFGGRFPADEHDRLSALLIDSPVLAGHRKDKLPLARTFHAETVERNSERWVKAYFYWLRSADGADSLRENIDGGVIKECSIGFTFSFAECSICGRDIRLCEHEPLEQYEVGGVSTPCHFNYRKIERVLETSLVYRGATPGTSFTRDLRQFSDGNAAVEAMEDMAPLSLSDLPSTDTYLVIPHYDALHCRIGRVKGRPVCRPVDATIAVQNDRLAPVNAALSSLGGGSVSGRLVGYRGRDRCSVADLVAYLAGHTSPVRRLVLHLLPTSREVPTAIPTPVPGAPARMIPHRFTDRNSLAVSAREIMTASGVEVQPLGNGRDQSFHILPQKLTESDGDRYELYQAAHERRAYLRIVSAGTCRHLVIHEFHVGRFKKGARFIAESLGTLPDTCRRRPPIATGRTVQFSRNCDGIAVTLDGPLAGSYRFRQVTLDGRRCTLVYRHESGGEQEGGTHDS